MLEKLGVSFVRSDTLNTLVRTAHDHDRLRNANAFFDKVEELADLKELNRLLFLSKGQILQDLFVASVLGYKREGYFVEFGAANGVDGSNTWLLEKHFGWNGILAEPARTWHAALGANRSAIISHNCVWSETGTTLIFNERKDAGFSTLETYVSGDRHAAKRASASRYSVKTISLEDLLEGCNAPRILDYLSIDTEGSEYDILSDFQFDKWDISVVTVEHNHGPRRNDILKLLVCFDYVRVLQDVSQFDDWYVKSRLLPRAKALFADRAV